MWLYGYILKRAKSHILAEANDLCGDVCIVHCSPAFAEAYFSIMWGNHRSYVDTPYHAHGGVSYRRREDAIATHVSMNHRLASTRNSFMHRLHDVRNAFPSPSFDTIRKEIHISHDGFEAQALTQHIEEHVCSLSSLDGVFMIQSGSGVPQGIGPATKIFNRVYWRATDKYLETLL